MRLKGMERLVFEGKLRGSWKFLIVEADWKYYLLKVSTNDETVLDIETLPADDIQNYIEFNV